MFFVLFWASPSQPGLLSLSHPIFQLRLAPCPPHLTGLSPQSECSGPRPFKLCFVRHVCQVSLVGSCQEVSELPACFFWSGHAQSCKLRCPQPPSCAAFRRAWRGWSWLSSQLYSFAAPVFLMLGKEAQTTSPPCYPTNPLKLCLVP